MAPTICVAEVPMAGTTLCTYSCRQQRSQNGVKRRSLIRERMLLRAGTTVSSSSSCENHSQRLECTDTVPHCSIPDKSSTRPSSVDEQFRRLIATRKGTFTDKIAKYYFLSVIAHAKLRTSYCEKIPVKDKTFFAKIKTMLFLFEKSLHFAFLSLSFS